MKNRWNDIEAQDVVRRYAAEGVPEELALRVYSSRLIGSDPALVLHGGGNTSVKGHAVRGHTPNTPEAAEPVLYVKGSGWDLATIEPAGFPGVWLNPLLELRRVDALSDEAMVRTLRSELLDPAAPNPSVEALLHAFLPHRFVDHSHADAILALVDQPDPEAVCREVFGARLAVLPFVFPGFPLAGRALACFERDTSVEGLVLINHGLFTFGETAQESYERMIKYVGLAEDALARGATSRGKGDPTRIFPARPDLAAQGVAPAGVTAAAATDTVTDAFTDNGAAARAAALLRGALAVPDDGAPGGYRRMVLHLRTSAAIRAFVDGADLADYARRGVITPDHIIRTKNLPLVLPPFPAAAAGAEDAAAAAETRWGEAVRAAVAEYQRDYAAYFEAGLRHTGQRKTMLDPLPRVLLLPGLGVFTAGRSEREAIVAADVYEHTVDVIARAEAYGRYTPLEPLPLFEMEYWSLEQAKLGKGAEAPLARHVVLVTGAASGIGAATARAFAAQGAQVVLLDLHSEPLQALAQQLTAKFSAAGGGAFGLVCDVTQREQVAAAFRAAALRFGGVDIVVSNAGAVWQGHMAEVPEAELRQSFELNFFAHQHVAAEAVTLFRRQGTGGQLLFNASKSAYNPGPALGPYTVPKAALLALMKQYALDYAPLGVRANAVNADRVPTELFGEGVLEQRAAARGLSVEAYLSGNLLGRMVRAEDVAAAFVMLAKAERTTATTLPVDGGNIAASPR